MLNKAALFVLMILASSFASSSTIGSYSISHKNYSKHIVTVQTAVDLAYSAYFHSCIKSSPKKEEGNLKDCISKSRAYIEENVIEIMDQN